MEEAEAIHHDDEFPTDGHDLSPLDDLELPLAQEALQEDQEGEQFEELKSPTQTLYKQKLVEILKNLNTPELEICSQASKEFISLLKKDSGGEILCEYIQSSPRCMELEEAWKLRRGKPGMLHVLSLVAVILDHPGGKSRSGGIARRLDSFARSIIETKLDDVYVEINSQEFRRQSAALRLLASVVQRSVSLASEVARKFDFKLPALAKLSGVKKSKVGKEAKHGGRRATRHAFVQFALSFLKIGNPRLLRWVLQQKEMYFGVLRGLGSDDEETAMHVLATLRDKVLIAESLVPPGLRSVLFGSITLEQLIYISGNPMAGPAANIAHEVLVMVCTDPCNGLMPSPNLKGNEKRLSELMKKLKATEVTYHRDLLLAVLSRRPSLCSAYMDEFPYHLEPRSSSLWFAAISLAADIISSTNAPDLINSLASHNYDLLDVNNDDIQSILRCIIPRTFTRSVINKGLLHSDILVKHGSLRVLLESLKSLDSLLSAIEEIVERTSVKQVVDTSRERTGFLHGIPEFSCSVKIDSCLVTNGVSAADAEQPGKEKWVSLMQHIQDEIRAVLPDPQVLLKLLSLPSNTSLKHSCSSLKRSAQLPEIGLKKLKSSILDENVDIVVSGIDVVLPDDSREDWKKDSKQELDVKKNHMTTIAQVWGLKEDTMNINREKDAENFLRSKILDVLTFYLRTLPIALEGSFDFFKILPNNPLSLSIDQQLSLFSLLVEYVGQSPRSRTSSRAPDLMYRHLQPLIYVLLFSEDKRVRDQAYILARTAMISTGAFDENFIEIDAWFFFLPAYNRDNHSVESWGAEVFRDLSLVVIAFLCDAVSTVGNNLHKYWDHMQKLISEDVSPGFSPLIICVLQKCLRLLQSDSGAFKLHEKSMISLYVSNTLSLILQTQVDVRILPGLIHSILNESFKNFSSVEEDEFLCEWRPLKKLLRLAHDVLHEESSSLFFVAETTDGDPSSLSLVLAKVKEFMGLHHGVELVGLATAFLSSVICATPNDILKNFPHLISVARTLFESCYQFLPWVFLDHNFLASVANMWPEIFYSSLEMIESTTRNNCRVNNDFSCNEAIEATGKLALVAHLDHIESAATAFSVVLQHSPFYILLSAILSFDSSTMDSSKKLGTAHLDKMLELLRLNISESSVNNSVLFLKLVLFWTYQIILSYRAKPSNVLEELFHLCFSIIEYIFEHLLMKRADTNGLKTLRASSNTYIQEVVALIFQHPTVCLSLSHPWCGSKKPANETLEDSVEAFFALARQVFHPMDHCIMQFLRKVIDFLLGSGSGHSYPSNIHDAFVDPLVKAPMHLINKTVLLFRERFELCVRKRDLEHLLPSFNMFHVLMHFVSPFELLGLVHWMFCKLDDDSSGSKWPFLSAVSVGLYIADVALDMLYSYVRQPYQKSNMLWELDMKSFETATLQKVYFKILDYAISYNLERADLCLSKIVNAVYNFRSAKPCPFLLPFYVLLSRMVINSPMKMLVHCLYPTSKIKAKMLFQLVEVSPIHSSLYGKTLLSIIRKDLSIVATSSVADAFALTAMLTDENSNHALSEDDFVVLLPAALSFLTSNVSKLKKQGLKIFAMIPIFYSRILLDGFSNWKGYVSRSIFLEKYDDSEPQPLEVLHDIFRNSLLGKAIHMLHYFFLESGNSLKKKQRLKLFDSIYPHLSTGDELLDSEFRGTHACSYEESLKLANEVAAKISFTRLLLFPPENPDQFMAMDVDVGSKEITSKKASDRLNCAKLRFMNILMNTLDHIVRKFPLELDSFGTSSAADSYHVFSFLEHLILRNIVQLSGEIKGYVTQLPSIAFLTPFIKSSLLHRFEDPIRLKALRSILITLSDGRFSAAEILELILGHSQFVSTILCKDSSEASVSTLTGTLLQPVPSILKSVEVFTVDGDLMDGKRICDVPSKLKHNHCALDVRKLELIKLLRILYHIKGKQQSNVSANDFAMNSRELLLLLLSGYGATLSDTDLEMLHLMHEIESSEGSETIAEMNYMWGSAALKLRKEQAIHRLSPSHMIDDSETIDEWRKRLFRENVPVDSKLCVLTVLHFCSDRTSRTAPNSLKMLLQDNSIDSAEMLYQNIDIVQQYDPAFMLRFSIHSLLMGYIEPIEFARTGLLAITLISISSPDEEIRKLGYESLGNFKKALENFRNSKDVLQLKLLLTYLQNGIAEAWQKIPSVTAIFAAEASLILLDPSRNHFLTISKLLMQSSKVNLKAIPLFHTLFESGTIHFKTDRLWILQLLYAGLNSYVDAKIYLRNNLFELLLSFYASSLSDPESKILILWIVKKSVTLHVLAHYLVKECGLLSWLSTVVSLHCERLDGARKDFSLKIMVLVLKVINDVISLRSISEWLQDCALEQLSELSSYLHKMLVGSLKLLKENVPLVNSILNVMVSALRISQKRKIYQPHFTISLQDLYEVFQALNSEFSSIGCNFTLELGIKLILMTTPVPIVSHMDRARLLRLVVWAIPAALHSFCNQTKEPYPDVIFSLEENQREELLLSKLLRWLTASVILGGIFEKCPISNSGTKTLESLLESLIKEEDQIRESDFVAIEKLAVLILYIQQIVGKNGSSFPSVTAALCLLLLSIVPNMTGKEFLNANRASIAFLCTKIRCPPEANPAWRWSYYQPWKDLSSEQTEIEEMEEQHACQSLLIILSNALEGKPLGLPTLLHQDVERSGLFEWQRNIVLGSRRCISQSCSPI